VTAPEMLALEPITEEHVRTVCQPGTTKCCRYLTMSPKGWSCEKHGSFRALLDARVAADTMRARGDNCEGRASL
jgi:hypothetical protein